MIKHITALSQRGVASLAVASSRCLLFDLTCVNADGAPRYLALYDCSVWGGDGSHTPVVVYGPIPAGGRFSIGYGNCGLRLYDGLIVALVRPPRRRRVVAFGKLMIVMATIRQERGQHYETTHHHIAYHGVN